MDETGESKGKVKDHQKTHNFIVDLTLKVNVSAIFNWKNEEGEGEVMFH